jgi:hypothetical protein
MKGKCIGGPLDGQERDSDRMYLTTYTFTPSYSDIGMPMPRIAGTVQNHFYSWIVVGPDVGVWKYDGVKMSNQWRQ